MIPVQGELRPDGRFSVKDVVAPDKWQGIIFDGQLVKGGPSVFLIYGPKVSELTIVQGTWYAICSDPKPVALRISDEKESRNRGMFIQVWDYRVSPPALLKEINKPMALFRMLESILRLIS